MMYRPLKLLKLDANFPDMNEIYTSKTMLYVESSQSHKKRLTSFRQHGVSRRPFHCHGVLVIICWHSHSHSLIWPIIYMVVHQHSVSIIYCDENQTLILQVWFHIKCPIAECNVFMKTEVYGTGMWGTRSTNVDPAEGQNSLGIWSWNIVSSSVGTRSTDCQQHYSMKAIHNKSLESIWL